ncbi:MAG TPA: hypothetical protein VFA04_27080 [Bryobacteraceae bacterium]|jgi:hypothetical protein|nr:hypothetical protein [Bryobacteraceae bacterium]
MSGERTVTRPLVARKRNGSRLDLILIDAGRIVSVLAAEESGSVLLRYKDQYLVADPREVHTRTVPVSTASAGA